MCVISSTEPVSVSHYGLSSSYKKSERVTLTARAPLLSAAAKLETFVLFFCFLSRCRTSHSPFLFAHCVGKRIKVTITDVKSSRDLIRVCLWKNRGLFPTIYSIQSDH